MVNLKTPEFQAAKEALFGFLKKNKLNIFTDYSKDPVYGPEYRLLLAKFQLERDKILIDYPNRDFKNRKKYFKMKKDKKAKEAAKKAAEEKTAKKAVKSTEKKASKEKTEKKARVAKYDYPQIDGREMTAEEKKKYRAEQRKAAKGGSKGTEKKASKEKAEKTEKKAPKAPKEKASKEKTKSSKKSKKAAKDED